MDKETPKTCLARDCANPRDDAHFLCHDHWQALPPNLRGRVATLKIDAKEGYRQAIASIVVDHYWPQH